MRSRSNDCRCQWWWYTSESADETTQPQLTADLGSAENCKVDGVVHRRTFDKCSILPPAQRIKIRIVTASRGRPLLEPPRLMECMTPSRRPPACFNPSLAEHTKANSAPFARRTGGGAGGEAGGRVLKVWGCAARRPRRPQPPKKPPKCTAGPPPVAG
jgi:hypothetical protein